MAFQSLKNFTRTLTSLVNRNQRKWNGQTFPLVTATEEDKEKARKLFANLKWMDKPWATLGGEYQLPDENASLLKNKPTKVHVQILKK